MSSASTPAYGATLGEILATLEAAGFTGQMAARPAGHILCLTCRQESPAADFDLQAMRRTEGASDPDDMLAVAALVCPRCGARATVVLGYGPDADPDESDVLAALGNASPPQ